MFVRNQSITYKVALDTSPSSQYSDGTYPIVLQLTYKRKVFRKRLGFRSDPNHWDNERYVSDKRMVRNYVERNEELNLLEDKAIYNLNKHFKDSFDYKKFSSLMDRDEQVEITFKQVWTQYANQLYGHGRAGTAKYYEDVGASVENFQANVCINDMDRNWIKNYVNHYISKGTKCVSYLRGIKALFGVAMNEFDLEYSIMPFKTAYNPKGYDISDAKKIKVVKAPKNGRLIKCFTQTEMETLKNYEPDNQGKERAYDLFMFSYFTGGVNAKDIALMKYEDIIEGDWYYEREKTGEGGQGKPLTDKALALIEKYKNNTEYVFPWVLGGKYLSEKAIKIRMSNFLSNLRRRYLSISKECDFNGHFTFYTARISAATILVNKGANLKAVQTALDHSNISMTSNYLRGVDKDVMRETLAML
jgi:integrase